MHSFSTRLILSASLGIAALGLPAFALGAQSDSTSQSQDDSLADAARRAREQKKSEAPPKQVWTNENLPVIPKDEPVLEKTPGQAAEGEAAAGDDAKKEAKPDAAADDAKKAAQQEAAWRQKFAEARKKLDDDQRELDLLQRELGVKSQQYFSDPNTALRDQYQRDSGPGGGGEVNNTRQKIDEKQKQIEADQQAISDLEEGLRKAGLPPGWSRP